jgi:hypothetical protein
MPFASTEKKLQSDVKHIYDISVSQFRRELGVKYNGFSFVHCVGPVHFALLRWVSD